MDFEALATPTEITYLDLRDAIGHTYMRGADPSRVLHLIFKFARGKGSSEIPSALYPDFLNALGKL